MKHIIYILVIFITSITTSFAKSDIKFLEQQLSFLDKKRTSKLTVFNQGDEAGTANIVFKKRIIDKKTGESSFELMDHPYNKYPHNIDITKFIRISPKKVTLDPKGKQTFRLFLRKPADLPDGEYSVYAFLDVKQKHNFEFENSSEEASNIGVGININYGVPIVVAHGKLNAKIEDFTSFKVTAREKKYISANASHDVEILLKRSGNATSSGFISIVYEKPGKDKVFLFAPVSIPPDHEIYRFRGSFAPKLNFESLNKDKIRVILYKRNKKDIVLNKKLSDI